MKVTEETALFTDALATINKAVEANKDKMPYEQFIQLADKLAQDLQINVGVYTDDAGNVHDHYTVVWRDGSFELQDHGKTEGAVDWKVSREYLEQLRDNPEEYKQHPEKLDLDWLKSRLGV